MLLTKMNWSLVILLKGVGIQALTLKALLHLTKIYCDRYQVKLVGTKTKLLVFNTKKTKVQAKVELALTTISVDGDIITPTTQATHVGVVRSPIGNGPNIAARLAAHRRSVTTKEEKLLDQQYKVHIQRLLRPHQATPAPALEPSSAKDEASCCSAYFIFLLVVPKNGGKQNFSFGSFTNVGGKQKT